MKKLLSIVLAGFLSCFVFGQSGKNIFLFSYFKDNGQDGLHLAYSRDGYQWLPLKNDRSFLQPVLSKDSLMRDPCIIRGSDGQFHMVWTVSWAQKGIGYASSPDLVHWSKQLYIPVMEHEPLAKNCWAPELIYDQQLQQYMIYWATTIPGKFPKTDSLGDNNHRIYYVTTKDFKSFSKTTLLYDHGFNVIDATIQPVKDGYIMFLKDETLKPVAEKNIRTAFSKNLYTGYTKPSAPITGNYWAEGATAVKKDGNWMVYFDKYMDKKYGAISSSDLVNWTDISHKISMPEGLRHGTVFMITPKEFAYLQSQSR